MKDYQYSFESHATKRMSLIVATKNRGDDLDKTLASLRALKGEDDEVIVIDAASEDNTREVIKKYGNFVDIFVSEPDLDGAHAFNKGILLSRGKYVKPIGHDNYFDPEAQKKAIQILEEHPEIDLLLCGGTMEGNGRVRTLYVPPGVNYGVRPEDVFRHQVTNGGGHFIRRSAFARAGLTHRGNCSDSKCVLDFIASGCTVKFCRLNSYHVPFYDHPFYGKNVPKQILQGRKKKEKFWLGLVKEHCSRSFYYKYMLSRKAKQNPFFKKFRIIAAPLYKKFSISDVKSMRDDVSLSGSYVGDNRKKYVWDGGFS